MQEERQAQCDIDRIIAAVQAQLPEVRVWRWPKQWPNDDDGIWWFSLPGVSRDIQLENSYGNCPFIVETDEQCCKEALKATTVEEAVAMIAVYLTAAKESRSIHLAGQLYWP